MLELTGWAERGFDLAITPDGPRGPRHRFQPGAVYLAQVTGFAVIPVIYQYSPRITLKSWDRFMVPLPFCRCPIRLGTPLRVSRDADELEQERVRVQLEKALNGVE